jgi:hypothetical protein|tara:strand:+ start:494 stop:697 length:204 start_codon:yes stop_codon:yes gene_type:complete
MMHIITYRAGQPGYIDAHQRGTVDIWHDQKRYVYRSATAKQARAFIWRRWGNITITGRYPSYTLESK